MAAWAEVGDNAVADGSPCTADAAGPSGMDAVMKDAEEPAEVDAQAAPSAAAEVRTESTIRPGFLREHGTSTCHCAGFQQQCSAEVNRQNG